VSDFDRGNIKRTDVERITVNVLKIYVELEFFEAVGGKGTSEFGGENWDIA